MYLAKQEAEPACGIVDIDGRPISYRSYRSTGARGPPIVLVHGFVVSSRYMVPLMRALASDHRVYAPDLPGFGRSYRPQKALSVDALAGALDDWLKAAGLRRVAMFANSFGCQIATALCAAAPERVERLVLQGPTGDPEIRSRLELALRSLALLPQEVRDGMLGILLADYRAAGLRGARDTLSYLLADRAAERLADVSPPTLVIRGTRDAVVRPAWARSMAARLPRGRYAELPGGHNLNFSCPGRLAEVIRSFLAEGGPLDLARA